MGARIGGFVIYTESDPTILQEGVFGLQIHQGAASEAWYKDITIVDRKGH